MINARRPHGADIVGEILLLKEIVVCERVRITDIGNRKKALLYLLRYRIDAGLRDDVIGEWLTRRRVSHDCAG